VGDHLRVAGRETGVRVRGIESAGLQVDAAGAGMRCAVNLAGRGVDSHSVTRGHWLVGATAGPLSQRLDVRLKVLDSEAGPLKQWTPVHVHHGAAFVTGRVTLPGGEPIAPGEQGLAQIVTDRGVSAVYGERVVLRDTSGRRTLGGAWIIDPYAPRRVRDRRARIRVLECLAHPDPADALAGAVAESVDGVDPVAFAEGRNLALADVLTLAGAVDVASVDTAGGRRLVMPGAFRALQDALHQALAEHHAAHPADVGPGEAELLRHVARTASPSMAGAALAALLGAGAVVRDGMSLRLAAHQPALSPGDAALWDRVAAHITAVTTKPSTTGDLSKSLEVDRIVLLDFLERAARRGQLVRVAANRFFHPRALLKLAQSAHALGVKCGDDGFDARAYRDATDIGRNLTIEVLEFFDVVGLTRRAGDRRRVVREPEAIFGGAP